MKIITYIKREFRCTDLKYALIFALATLGIGILSFLVGGSSSAYGNLLLPKFAPPPLAFGIIWTVLFLIIGAAAGIVYSGNCSSSKKARIWGLIYYAITLFFVFIWYPVFFGLQTFTAALIIIALIAFFTFLTMKNFVRVSIISGLIMFVFLLWSAFAFVLNFCVVLLN